MELVKFKKEVIIPIDEMHSMKLLAGEGYIMARAIATSLADIWGSDTIESMKDFRIVYGNKEYNGESLDGKKILIWRTGGAGDLLFLSPSIKKMKELYPTASISVATSSKFHEIFSNLPYADHKYILPISETLLKDSDYFCIFEGLIENLTNPDQENAYDLFARRLYVYDKMTNKEKTPILFLSSEDENWAEAQVSTFRGGNRPLVGMQLAASAILRTYKYDELVKIARELSKDNQVLIFGGPGESDKIDGFIGDVGNSNNLFNIPKRKCSWLKSAALIKRLDLMITPDSGLAHFAAAMGTPLLAIYGPFRSLVRLKYYKNAVGIDANAVCQSCFQHSSLPCKWIMNPELNTESKCFDCLKAELIINVAKQMLSK